MTKQEDLIAMCRLGDPAAYTALYNQHAGAVYNTILRLVAHTGEAEDLLQETFVAAFQGIKGYKETGTFAAWIKRIAINKTVDNIRKRKIRFVEFEPERMTEEEEELMDEAEFEFTIDAVNEAIENLPENYRAVFNLFAVENIPQAEIARLLGIEHTTVRTQYHRAKQKILNALKVGGYHER
jgi:RNA polymerase sigma factor (sigma-70 family)